ncbi:hypothetical protein OIE61_44300 [Streptomyces sp. NBC_01762]|uniref:hypothetical protein n=1 Tax=Streptomyces sp. NBC_01762 TaxID=2975933 RepID=UPI002DDAF3E2|nr:hypothetical protein [Streptomyces sp. NBC_01762]WSC42572.1 hypothetical protein OIE61_00175 [Streptomyces sp. NBC_01762]WSC50281.1 hypothetical protein OIE61_44300 [Streptomyces sp. NBC_01762]
MSEIGARPGVEPARQGQMVAVAPALQQVQYVVLLPEEVRGLALVGCCSCRRAVHVQEAVAIEHLLEAALEYVPRVILDTIDRVSCPRPQGSECVPQLPYSAP